MNDRSVEQIKPLTLPDHFVSNSIKERSFLLKINGHSVCNSPNNKIQNILCRKYNSKVARPKELKNYLNLMLIGLSIRISIEKITISLNMLKRLAKNSDGCNMCSFTGGCIQPRV